jgi:hypothetical protein
MKKILYIIFSIFILIILTFSIYLINTEKPKIKNFRKEIKTVVKKGNLVSHLVNDYNEVFLPKTQFIDLKFKKINLDFINIGGCYIRTCYPFFLEQHKNNLIIVDRTGLIKTITFSDLDKKNLKFKKIKNNLNYDNILDTYIDDNEIYIVGKKKEGDHVNFKIAKGIFDKDQIIFQDLIELNNKNCIRKSPQVAGKMQLINNNPKKILLSINQAGWADNPSDDNLNSNSICGKILLIDPNTKDYEVFSSGHRNIAGLYADDTVIIATEHGPNGGDEINNIKQGENYGWPVVSYGEKYSRNRSDKEPNYKKNHLKNNYNEPIFSFVPSIGISEIIKLSNNFSNLWEDNFLIGSMNKKYLYRVKFNEDYNKIIYYEPIYIGDRIRDLIYNSRNKKIILALEFEGALGILSLE